MILHSLAHCTVVSPLSPDMTLRSIPEAYRVLMTAPVSDFSLFSMISRPWNSRSHSTDYRLDSRSSVASSLERERIPKPRTLSPLIVSASRDVLRL